jgi:hypothetical protein
VLRVSPQKLCALAFVWLATFPSCGFVGQAAAGATGVRVPRVSDGGCGFAPAVRPTIFVLACATGNDQLVNIHWSEWGGSVAIGTGEHWYNSCNPDCASSRTWITTAAGIKLSYVVPTSSGPIFRTLSYREIAAQMCDPGCVTKWRAWQAESSPVSGSYHKVGALCPAADVGLAADGWYGSLVWCETIGTHHEWVHIS